MRERDSERDTVRERDGVRDRDVERSERKHHGVGGGERGRNKKTKDKRRDDIAAANEAGGSLNLEMLETSDAFLLQTVVFYLLPADIV